MTIAIMITGQGADGHLLARLITEAHDTGSASGLVISDEVYSVLPELSRFSPHDRGIVKQPISAPDLVMPEMATGDIVVAEQSLGSPDGDDVAIRLLNHAEVIANAADEDEALAIASRHLNAMHVPGRFRPSLTCADKLEYEAAAEHSRSEPNEALILAWSDERGEIGDFVLAHKGALLFFAAHQGSTCADMCMSEADEPGLWLFKDGKAWTSRDRETGIVDDWGLDGDFEPISLQAAAERFGVTAESLLADIEEVYPFEFEGDVPDALHHPAGELPRPAAH